jgi:hypothetical protein
VYNEYVQVNKSTEHISCIHEVTKMSVNVNNNKKNDVNTTSQVVNKKQVINSKLPTNVIDILEHDIKQTKSIDEVSGRPKIVNWLEVMDWCIEQQWCTSEQIKEHVLSTYKKNKLYYSEFLRFVRSEKTNKIVKITCKEIESGEYKNVYYKFEKRTDKVKK